MRAHECYVRARQELWRFTAEGLERARRLIQTGLDIVGGNELLLSAMGTVHWQFVNGGIDPSPDHLRRAAEYCERALACGGRATQTHLLRAFLQMASGDFEAALRHLKAARAADPNDPDALYWSVVVLEFGGKSEVAAPLIDRLVAVDPLSPQTAPLPGWHRFLAGDLEQGLDSSRLWHERDPENPIAHWMYGSILIRNQRLEQARAVFTELQARPEAGTFARLASMFLRVLQRDRQGVLSAVTPDLVEAARLDSQYSWEVAAGFAADGATEQALDWLRNAVERGFVNYRFLSEHDPLLAGLRGDARFRELMADARARHDRLPV